ncbi:MAG: efflux RND transporter periplasmic adaptor subunit [Acidobacteriia bacterium]|nr:efflux RND transporter periplasmic adaptor subunit [Terriglobia bacterium]
MNDTHTDEDRLRAEIDELKRQLEEQKNLVAAPARHRPSRAALAFFGVLALALIIGGFFVGYTPRRRREAVLAAESKAGGEALPVVNVVAVERSAGKTQLVLPGNIQAVTEAPVLARASGYVARRYVDIGDRVAAGQPLAQIEAPELDQQIRPAKAALDQAHNAIAQSEAALKQGRTNENLARVTAGRWKNLFEKGVVSRQENDTYQAQWASQQANVEALEKAVAVAGSSAAALQANLDRINELKSYQTVRAPFAGVITLRNVDTGALINEGNTLLFRIAQTGRLRIYINLPQSEAGSVRPGQAATLVIPDLSGKKFAGTVTRTASALDPATRTLLTEVQISNTDGALLPGMYAQVDFSVQRARPSLAIRGDTLVVRSDGPQVAVVGGGGQVHFARIQLGRDYGDHLEVLSGLEEGQQIVVNPNDAVREGARVKPVALREKNQQ